MNTTTVARPRRRNRAKTLSEPHATLNTLLPERLIDLVRTVAFRRRVAQSVIVEEALEKILPELIQSDDMTTAGVPDGTA